MNRIEVIAEIANAHQGRPELAAQLADAALDAGADAIKFQVYTADELLVRTHPRYEHFKNQSFSRAAWTDLIGGVKAKGGHVYCDVFGLEALAVALAEKADGIKVHSSDLTNTPLLQELARSDRRVFLSVGGSTVREIAYAARHLVHAGVRPTLLHGFQSYPTAVEDSGLIRLAWLKKHFGHQCDIGYQDHVAGDDPFAVTLPLMAVAMGATVIEKHITLDRAAKGVDWYSSLNPGEFARFVRSVRQAEAAIGTNAEAFAESERDYRKVVKKHWVVARELAKGHILGSRDLVMKRVHEQPSEAVEFEKLVGRPLLRTVAEEDMLTRAHVPHTVWAMVVARMRSSRLPGKALADMAGVPAIAHLFARLKQARRVNRIVLCTTRETEDDPLARLAAEADIACHRGPVEDVLGRMLEAMEGHAVDIALRVTGDDILVDPDYLDRAVDHHLAANAEYSDVKALPSGTEVEVFDVELLRAIHRAAVDPGGTEYLTAYVTDHPDQIRCGSVPVDPGHVRNWRLTLDTPEDYALIRGLIEAMAAQGKALSYRMDDIIAYFAAHPEALAVNAMVRQRQTPITVNTALDWDRFAR